MDIVGIVAPGLKLSLENTGSIVHRSTLKTGEGQDDGVVGTTAAEGLILGAACTLVAYEVGIGAAKTSGAHCLMSVDHDMMLGSLLDDMHIVVVHRLRVVVVATRDDISHISSLHCIITILVHEVEGSIEMTLIVLSARRCLVVHHQFDTLGVCILVEILDIEVGIRSDEVKDIALPHICPVFPSDVPTLNQYLVETVGCGEVDILLHVGGVCTVASVGSKFGVVGLTELYRRQTAGIFPCALTYNHLPPYTAVFCGVNP